MVFFGPLRQSLKRENAVFSKRCVCSGPIFAVKHDALPVLLSCMRGATGYSAVVAHAPYFGTLVRGTATSIWTVEVTRQACKLVVAEAQAAAELAL